MILLVMEKVMQGIVITCTILLQYTLHHMYYGKPETSNVVVVYPQVTLPLKLDEEREGVTLIAFEPKIKFKDEENKWNTVHMRSGSVVKPLVLYMNE